MVMLDRDSSGVPDGAVVAEVACSEAAPGVDPFVLLAQAHQAVAELHDADIPLLDREWFNRYAQSANELLAAVDAVNVGIAAEVQSRGHDRGHGFFSTKAWVKHHVHLSGPDAARRVQVMRMFELLPEWAQAARRGEVGVEQTRLMARVAANPRVHVAVMAKAESLLVDAMFCSFDDFERRLRQFERLADPDGARSRAEKNHDGRDARMVQRPDGSWRFTASFGSLQGAEFNEIFAHFVHAEFESDWAEAKQRVGTEREPTIADLRRSEPHRRADAITAALLAAAAAPGDGTGPLPTLNIVIDEDTLAAVINGTTPAPSRYREVICRTQNGDLVDLSEAASTALWAHIRRAVRDSAGVVVDLGRRRRLFRGNARDAAMLLEDRCIWPECDRPVRHCQTDHSVGWKAHGATVPRNAGPLCGPHNRLKDRGSFTARRDQHGKWSISDANGNPVG